MASADPGFALYVHWPFCAAKCPYCDFNSHVRRQIDHSVWQDALLRDMETQAAQIQGQALTSIFFGGGTPSLMEPSVVGAVIETAERLWGFAPDIEISLEANPTSVEADRFAGFRAAGVNRVSVGIQALNDTDLKALGRMHSVHEALAAYDIAQRVFGRTSFDLIYARQNQSAADWEKELTLAVSLAGDHLSLYQLTVEENTRFWELSQRGKLRGLPNDDLAVTMFELTQEVCEAAGYQAYEVSNHARPGAECRHNLTYWRYGNYIGVGPGAHGRVQIDGQLLATASISNPEKWLAAVGSNGQGIDTQMVVPKSEQAIEILMMGLRLTEGVDLHRFYGCDGDLNEGSLCQLQKDGLLKEISGRLYCTKDGRLVLNRLLAELIA